MTRDEKITILTEVLSANRTFAPEDKARIEEKTDEQLDYILSPIDRCIYLEACAGSGKTEVLGLKAAYEICKWRSRQSGIAVLTFTNDATATIADRVASFYGKQIPSNHFIGTFSSFVHGHIAQRFGYKFYHMPKEKTDKSFRVVDSDTSLYNNHWLDNYALNLPGWTTYASQLNYRESDKNWYVVQGENARRLTDLYRGNPERVIGSANACKSKFLHDGFATFEDMNIIALKCLRDDTICHFVAKKFPVILIDECQDLSASELGILSLLIGAGTVVHYIGDLHQAIYSFKDALPEQYKAHLAANHFETWHLSRNFRSTQKIVDLSRRISGITCPIVGSAESKCGDYDCCYVEYNEEKDAISAFVDALNRFGISAEDAIVLVRTQSAKQRLSNGFSNDFKKHPIINAIQLWQRHDLAAQRTALSLLALQLQRWMGFHGKSNAYYYSDEVCSSSVSWRLLLRDILVELCADPEVTTMHGLNYGAWYLANKRAVISVVKRHLGTVGKNLTEKLIRSPNGTAEQKIAQIELTGKEHLRVETIHSVKGGTFDAVLLLSSPDGRGKTGFWGNWLKSDEESGRIGYVASTRPRYLLCWGVHKLSDAKRQVLEGIGCIKLESDVAILHAVR